MNTKLIGLLTLLCWLVTAPTWAAFGVTFTANGSTSVFSASTTGTVSISAASGDTICVGTDVLTSSRTMAITDDKGGGSNTYTRSATREIASQLEVWLDCTVSTGAVTQVTATISSTIAGNSHMYVWVVTGAYSSVSTNSVTAETNPTGTAHNPGTVTITDATALLLGASVHTSTGQFTIDGTYTSRYDQVGIIVGDKEVSANDDMANTTAGNRLSISYLLEIRPAAGASVNFFPRRLQVNP